MPCCGKNIAPQSRPTLEPQAPAQAQAVGKPCGHETPVLPPEGEDYSPKYCRVCWLYETNAKYNKLWGGKGVKPKKLVLPCVHLGGDKGGEVFACGKYGECTKSKAKPGVSCCASCSEYRPDTFRLVAPIGTKLAGTTRKKHPWDFRSTCILPHLGHTEHLPLLLDMLRAQTEPPYIVIVDTGSTQGVCDTLERQRAEDVEIHYVRGGAYTNTSEPVTVALDLGFARANTELIFLTHTDVFPMRQDALEWIGKQVSEDTPVVGWQMSERSWITDQWRGLVSHTFTMLHAKTMRRIGATWHLQRGRDVLGITDYYANGWPDTETTFGQCLKAAGITPKLLGEEYNFQRQTTEWWDHARSLTGLRVYSYSTELAAKAEVYAATVIAEATERLRQWREE